VNSGGSGISASETSCIDAFFSDLAYYLTGLQCTDLRQQKAHKCSRKMRTSFDHLIDEIIFLEDVKHDGAENGRLQNPSEHLHRKPRNARS
jgi:hypothetical protein